MIVFTESAVTIHQEKNSNQLKSHHCSFLRESSALNFALSSDCLCRVLNAGAQMSKAGLFLLTSENNEMTRSPHAGDAAKIPCKLSQARPKNSFLVRLFDYLVATQSYSHFFSIYEINLYNVWVVPAENLIPPYYIFYFIVEDCSYFSSSLSTLVLLSFVLLFLFCNFVVVLMYTVLFSRFLTALIFV